MRIDYKNYKLFDLFEFLVGVLSVVASLTTLYSFYKAGVSDLFFVAFFIPVGISIMFFIKLWKLRQIAASRLHIFSENFHKLTHKLRDEFYILKMKSDSDELESNFLMERFKSTTQFCIESLATTLSESTGEKVSVCIKYFGKSNENTINSSIHKDVHTLCRSYNTEKARLDTPKISEVGKNSDFEMLLHNNKAVFYCLDLKEYETKGRRGPHHPLYRNTNENWHKYYRTTIVVPIRIKQDIINANNFKGDTYDVVGFLCVDSQSTSTFRAGDIDAYAELVQSYADCLYKYFDRFIFYQLCCKKKEVEIA